jgi:hypothetical protein
LRMCLYEGRENTDAATNFDRSRWIRHLHRAKDFGETLVGAIFGGHVGNRNCT